MIIVLLLTLLSACVELLGKIGDNAEAGFSLYILGLPSTYLVDNIGAITTRWNWYVWYVICTILFVFNSFCIIAMIAVLLKMCFVRKSEK